MMTRTKMAVSLSALALVLLAPWSAHAATVHDFVSTAIGVNGVWLDGVDSPFPQNLEAGLALSVALHERLKLIGDAYHGFNPNTGRADAGVKFVVSDKASQRNLAIYLVGKRTFTLQSDVDAGEALPGEIAFGAGAGLRPFPDQWPALEVGIEGTRGATSHVASLYLAGRLRLPFP